METAKQREVENGIRRMRNLDAIDSKEKSGQITVILTDYVFEAYQNHLSVFSITFKKQNEKEKVNPIRAVYHFDCEYFVCVCVFASRKLFKV